MRTPSEREQWFLDRIGKTVFLNRSICPCETCAYSFQNGHMIGDKESAEHMYQIEMDLNDTAIKFRYFDTKKDAEDFEIINAVI